MMNIFLKYLLINTFCIIIFFKLLNENSYFKQYFKIFYSLILTTIVFIVRIYLPEGSTFPTIILEHIILMYIITEINIRTIIATVILSLGISYSFYTISSIICSLLASVVGLDADLSLTYFLIITSVLQCFFVNYTFKIKRLSKGMPFLINPSSTYLGIVCSFIIFICILLFRVKHEYQIIYVVCACLILLCFILLTYWWQKNIFNIYIKNLRKDEIISLYQLVKQKDEEINTLKENNDMLAKIIHKDNKFIPAMELAVKDYLTLPSKSSEVNGYHILASLEQLHKERLKSLEHYRIETKKIPLSKVTTIDNMISYMLNIAQKNNIDLDIMFMCDLLPFVNNIIFPQDLCTIIGDLLENAIIATKNCSTKKILLNIIQSSDNIFSLNIADSGTSFEMNVLSQLGLEKISTHLDEGGSGIGLLSTYELSKKYNASLIIEEYNVDTKLYTKKLSIIFDNKSKYVIKSNRAYAFKSQFVRQDVCIISELQN